MNVPSGDHVGALEAARAALAALEGGPAVAIVMRADGGGGGMRMLVREDGTRGSLGRPELDAAARSLGESLLREGGATTRTATVDGEPVPLYGEAHRRPARLVIVGAGHIALPLARVGVLLGFPVVVLDDRQEFATEERFPDASDVRRVDFAAPFRDVPVGLEDYVVLVTRAHRYDFDCLRALVERDAPPRYIGMVGSRRRVRAAFGALLDAGVSRERLATVRAPIGLDIGAETPEEIAISIAAELVAVRRDVEAGSLAARERVLERLLPGPEAGSGSRSGAD